MNIWDKIKMYLKWAFLVVVISGILSLIAIVIYGIVIYPLRKPIRWLWKREKWYRWIAFPLWIFLNDGPSNDIGYDWFWRAKNLYPTNWLNKWCLSYLWSGIRNPSWNIYEFIKPKTGSMDNLNIIDGDDAINKVLKWKLKDGTPNDNIGDYIDYSKAKLGSNHFEYSTQGVNYFNLSNTYIKPVLNWFIHHELIIGWNSSRPLIRYKWIIKRIDKVNLQEYANWFLKQ